MACLVLAITVVKFKLKQDTNFPLGDRWYVPAKRILEIYFQGKAFAEDTIDALVQNKHAVEVGLKAVRFAESRKQEQAALKDYEKLMQHLQATMKGFRDIAIFDGEFLPQFKPEN